MEDQVGICIGTGNSIANQRWIGIEEVGLSVLAWLQLRGDDVVPHGEEGGRGGAVERSSKMSQRLRVFAGG